MSGFEPILIGAAVGAGTSAVMGGNPIKGALLGGAGGGVGSLLSGSAGAAASGLNVAPAAASAPVNLADDIFTAGSGIGFKAPMAAASGITPSATGAAMGGGLVLPANAAQIMGQQPQGLLAGLKDYMPSGQAMAGLGLQAATQPRPIATAPAGGITAGRAPDMGAITELLKRRQPSPASLLSNYFG